MDSPQVLKRQKFPEPEQMKIRSEIIDPIIANTSLVRFQVPKTGILSTGSMLTFQVQVADDVSAFFPLRTGCFGVFKKVELTLGGKTIQVQDETALYNTMKRQFRRCEDKYGIDMVQKGTLDRMTNSFEDNGTLMMKDVEQNGNDFLIPRQYRPTNTNLNEWTVYLHELFPVLSNLSLPVGNLNENMFINLHLNSQIANGTASTAPGQGLISSFKSGTANTATSVIPVSTSWKLVADMLYFKDERMQDLSVKVASDEGINLIADEVITIKHQQPSLAAVPTGTSIVEHPVNIDVSLTGLSVKSLHLVDRPTVPVNTLLCKYYSQSYAKPESIQYRINDKSYYSKPLINEQRKMQELEESMGAPLYVSNCEYSFNQIATKSAGYALDNMCVSTNNTLFGYQQNTNLPGCQHFVGINLSTPKLGKTGLVPKKRITIERVTNPSGSVANSGAAREVTIFANVEKTVSFRNGTVIMAN